MSTPKVFISYTHDDADWVRQFAEALKKQEVGVSFDQGIPAGERWEQTLETGLRESDAVVAVLSSSNVMTPNVNFEIGAAMAGKKRLIPIVSDELEKSGLPFHLRRRRYLAKGLPEVAAREVAEALKQTVAA